MKKTIGSAALAQVDQCYGAPSSFAVAVGLSYSLCMARDSSARRVRRIPWTKRTNRLRTVRRVSIFANTEVHKLQEQSFQWRVHLADRNARTRLDDLMRSCDYSAQKILTWGLEYAREVADSDSASSSSLAVAMLMSMLADIAAWGADISVEDSQISIRLDSNTRALDFAGTARMRSALVRLRASHPDYPQILTQHEAIELLTTGRIRLVDASTNEDVASIFRRGVTTWSMPYRTREGRAKRFVLYGYDGATNAPLGILEIGDDAPLNTHRDLQLGFDATSALKFVTPYELAERFAAIRRLLRPEGLPIDPTLDVKLLVPLIDSLAHASRGRTGTPQEISVKKRMAYAARLIAGQAAAVGLIQPKHLGEGIRALRDLTLTRVNVEMTICGALPPFGGLLVGKLVASMAGHPLVRSFVDRPLGSITAGLFDADLLAPMLPNHGALFITTKGLYPKHSSQYNGVRIASRDGVLSLNKIGDTTGTTTSHLSDLTTRLAARVLERSGNGRVSRVYGSGGGKRQRTLEEAARTIGLPTAILHAQSSKPVYAVSLVENLQRVCLLNEAPIWRSEPYTDIDPVLFEASSIELWRSRWLEKARSRSRTLTLGDR